MSLTTSINVINLKDGFQMIQISHTIEKKMISIENERSYHTTRSSTIEKKNVASYATELIADQSIILEKSEIHQKHD